MNANQIHSELQKLLSNTKQKDSIIKHFQELKALCGKPGSSFSTAANMVNLLKETYIKNQK